MWTELGTLSDYARAHFPSFFSRRIPASYIFKVVITIAGLLPRSIAVKSGFRPGDRLMAVNGDPVQDLIDLRFFSALPCFEVDLLRSGKPLRLRVDNPRCAEIGILPEPFPIRRCNNRCVFCFVDQMPRGLRKSLYIKDEDYRLSFLDGAYICGTNLSEADFARIFAQRLSPLYLSVHATDETVRRQLLRNPSPPPVLPLLRRLAENRIDFHTQIVLCPGINDRAVLKNSIHDLAALHPHLLSIAVVPLGITRHREKLPALKAVDPGYARKLMETIKPLQTTLRKKFRANFLFLSDEFYIKAGLPLPPYSHYLDFPQYSNGVGMMRDFIRSFETTLLAAPYPKLSGEALVLTGGSAYPFLRRLFARLSRQTGRTYTVRRVENRLMGPAVTVSGLLSGADLMTQAQDAERRFRTVFIPPNALNADGITLDGLDLQTLSAKCGRPVQTPERLEDLLK